MKNGNETVGKQNFTYAELRNAWDRLVVLVGDGCYDIRNGYSLTDTKDVGEHQWWIPWNFDSLCETIEGVGGVITRGDLEVYWNDPAHLDADTDGHGITIENGKITGVY